MAWKSGNPRKIENYVSFWDKIIVVYQKTHIFSIFSNIYPFIANRSCILTNFANKLSKLVNFAIWLALRSLCMGSTLSVFFKKVEKSPPNFRQVKFTIFDALSVQFRYIGYTLTNIAKNTKLVSFLVKNTILSRKTDIIFHFS